MRERMVRAWSVKEKRFLIVSKMHIGYQHKIVSITEAISGKEYNFVTDEIILEEYFGIIAQEDTEIFEGDIVIEYPVEWGNLTLEFKGEVVFHDCCFAIRKKFKEGSVGYRQLSHNDSEIRYKVIGNIHERPELLDEKP